MTHRVHKQNKILPLRKNYFLCPLRRTKGEIIYKEVHRPEKKKPFFMIRSADQGDLLIGREETLQLLFYKEEDDPF